MNMPSAESYEDRSEESDDVEPLPPSLADDSFPAESSEQSPSGEMVGVAATGEITGPVELVVPQEDTGKRLDVFLAERFPYHSRMSLRKAISAGGVLVNERQVRPACKLQAGKRVSVRLPEMPVRGPLPEAIPLEILFEDEFFAVINKPPAMVVHPARGHWKGTLTAALAHHFEQLSDAGGPVRPGVVHRLDRDTSGVILVAKTNRAHFALCQQFEERVTEKEYLAIVVGRPDRDRDVIDAPIGVHPYQREKMAVRADHTTSKTARTFYEVTERYRGYSLLKVQPKTGRTHQIRVHLAHLGYPILCDKQYGGRARVTRSELLHTVGDEELVLERQALHAHRIKIFHPVTRAPLEFEAPIPSDIAQTIATLRAQP
ncbi:MAG: RluA family pseudouridine synthase [Planctomycetota bacterium]